ncbi:GTPase required for pre-60S ribosomal subunit nuclear export and maturation [Yamadazyma tenuis]|uniref:Nucleolar GTP-binding protein 2 n=1 Tax=Candida tenuis (strain ATCC 10573 / BCRC 21748 / CBS 615 / JCM 9827 / NBRC 10315 / NRRL Y-1498 / VKM Y-70) TaxID=590646 RepID=G3AZI8_CANTC|nr:NGP1NT-domain-containing protein [Yamadazyma tenuis ATCC 10573]EGV65587.1 NGP1NT-domain-containing protein [Yamadazyma tenuis ATCC 10573]WEJ96095.1 GTPase required for pre-60S ribosomal subunit nuclear export and maturation [Yamadazyma tenuis]
MGTGKKEKQRRIRQGDTKDGNIRVKGENFYRDTKRVKFLNMYKGGHAVRNAKGEIVQSAALQSTDAPTARVDPNRKWFVNTRVIAQDALTHFRNAMADKKDNAYQVLLRRNKLPMSLLDEKDTTESPISKIIETESYGSAFGPKQQRKKPRNLQVSSLEELAQATEKDSAEFQEKLELNSTLGLMGGSLMDQDGITQEAKEAIFSKGQSKRIWNELYKVIDSSDVVIHVLDARDPLGTRCESVEKYMKDECPHKHLIYVLNKCDLVPTWIAAAWVKHLSKTYPTLAFHASITNSFGKGSLIQLLRQFSTLHADRKQISVGFIGYPNTGKSSIINTLRRKKVCQVAPIPGETKVWQYITLMKKIFLIDCPGIVPPSSKDSSSDILFRGVVRVEHVSNPEQYIPDLLNKCERKHLERTYEIKGWKKFEEDASLLEEASAEFIELIARKHGKLLKGGEPDEHGVAKQVLNDFNRGKIPWFTAPPQDEEIREGEDKRAGIKRKRAEREEKALQQDMDEYKKQKPNNDSDDDDQVEGKEEQDWEGIKD